MQKKQVGNMLIAVLTIINVVLWLIFPPINDGRPAYTDQLIGEILASTAMILMSCAFFLATKPRFLEPYFGGLDQMYQSHKKTAMLSMFLIFAHLLTIPESGEEGFGGPLGMVAFVGMFILVLLTIAPRIPLIGGYIRFAYSKWLRSHKLIGIFYIIGIVHTFMVDNIVQHSLLPSLYLRVIGFGGAAAYLYQELLGYFVRKKYSYVVDAVQKLNGTTVEVALKPQGETLDFTAGQFVFVSFNADKTLMEPHPFTVSSSPKEQTLRLSIKGSGDWTRHVYHALQAGAEAEVEGAHGMFNYKTGGNKQIWIAAGIGITPFLSWVRDFSGEPSADIDLFYAVRGVEDGLFWDEVKKADQRYDKFRASITYSAKEGHLSPEKIATTSRGNITDKHIYLCGPIGMTEAFTKRFKQMGVPAKQIHFEEFNFR